MLSVFDPVRVRSHCDRAGIPGRALRSLYAAAFKQGHAWPAATADPLADGPLRDTVDALRPEWTPRTREAIDRLLPELEVGPLELIERVDAPDRRATKLRLALAAASERRGREIETVLLRYRNGRSTVCVSSQIGCALDCRFCATGSMGLVGQLPSEAILQQVLVARRLLAAEGRELRNVVFMGMGEPLHNVSAVESAIAGLSDGRLFNLPRRSLLVSTVGIPGPMLALDRRFPTLRWAISLHSADPEKRAALMPLATRISLDELRVALAELRVGRKGFMVEVIMIDGWTDGADDVRALTNYLSGLPAHINLIPFNSVVAASCDGRELRSSPSARIDAIADELRAAGFEVTRRRSLGAEVSAACGQLVRRAADRAGAPRPDCSPDSASAKVATSNE